MMGASVTTAMPVLSAALPARSGRSHDRQGTAIALTDKETSMRRQLLLQSIQAHLALLAEKHPKKAASPVARKAKQYVALSLRPAQTENARRAAA
jgi:hypothetical protein